MTPGEFWAGIAIAAVGAFLGAAVPLGIAVVALASKWGALGARVDDLEQARDDHGKRITALEFARLGKIPPV